MSETVQLIRPGDRIVQVRPKKRLNSVSGIVAMSIGFGDGFYHVLIYNGQSQVVTDKPCPEYEVGVVSPLGVDVAESGCAFPPIPKMVLDAYADASNRANIEWQRTHTKEHRAMNALHANLAKSFDRCFNMPEEAVAEARRLAEGIDPLEYAHITAWGLVFTLRDHKSDDDFKEHMLAAALTRVPELVRMVKPNAPEFVIF